MPVQVSPEANGTGVGVAVPVEVAPARIVSSTPASAALNARVDSSILEVVATSVVVRPSK